MGEPISDELILTEAESTLNEAMQNDGGMNQLIGREWKDSSPTKYRGGAMDFHIASKLFITFPIGIPADRAQEFFAGMAKRFDERQCGTAKVGMFAW